VNRIRLPESASRDSRKFPKRFLVEGGKQAYRLGGCSSHV
jgi:hypothetical protein